MDSPLPVLSTSSSSLFPALAPVPSATQTAAAAAAAASALGTVTIDPSLYTGSVTSQPSSQGVSTLDTAVEGISDSAFATLAQLFFSGGPTRYSRLAMLLDENVHKLTEASRIASLAKGSMNETLAKELMMAYVYTSFSGTTGIEQGRLMMGYLSSLADALRSVEITNFGQVADTARGLISVYRAQATTQGSLSTLPAVQPADLERLADEAMQQSLSLLGVAKAQSLEKIRSRSIRSVTTSQSPLSTPPKVTKRRAVASNTGETGDSPEGWQEAPVASTSSMQAEPSQSTSSQSTSFLPFVLPTPAETQAATQAETQSLPPLASAGTGITPSSLSAVVQTSRGRSTVGQTSKVKKGRSVARVTKD